MSERRAVVRHEHARIGRKIINFDTGGYGVCAWDTCDKDASSLYQVRTHEHAIPKSPENCAIVDAAAGNMGQHTWFAFCTERHKLYWVSGSGERAHEMAARYNGRISGMLPPGHRLTVQ